MAVINSPFVGNARGKLGEAVFLRSKGNTVARQYNPSPQNRRTVMQQAQRSVFSAAVKFFSRGVQNLFNFAFEHKRVNESDYNAFMRFNAKRGMYFGPNQNDDDVYPALGKFVMTRGSLGSRFATMGPYGTSFDFPTNLQTLPTITTLGQLTTFLADYGFAEGDILTWLFITSDSTVGSEAAPVVLGELVPDWRLWQITLDSASSDLLSDLKLSVTLEGPGIVRMAHTAWALDDEVIQAGCVVQSRVVAGSLRVSNSELELNTAAQLALEYGRTDTWRRVVMSEWGAEQLSILQGGISENEPSSGPAVRFIFYFTFPKETQELEGCKFTLMPGQSLQDMAAHLDLDTSDGERATMVVEQNHISITFETLNVGKIVPDSSLANTWVFSDMNAGGPQWKSLSWVD